jgi:6-phosphofructokinase 1
MLKLPHLPVIPTKIKCLGVLTSGGDAPGMNAAIRAIVRYGLAQKCTVKGILRGYSGILERKLIELGASSVANIIQRGGTILKTDRCEAFYEPAARKEAAKNLLMEGIEGLIVIGGDGSFTGAQLLEKETGFPVIGIPGTIDNDIALTDDTIGFDTAVNTAIEAIDRIRDTATSHDRIFLVEVMGHSSGFIAMQVAIAGGAETVVLPEKAESVDTICNTINRGISRGKTSSIIVVAEGPTPGLSSRIANDLTHRGYPSRVCILGHTQRGGSPTTHDRVLASFLGASAVAYLLAGQSNAMVGVQKSEIVLVPFSEVIGKKKSLPVEMLELSQILAS